MHVDEVLCHGENGGATCETSHQGCIMRKAISKAVTAGGRFDFFWTLAGLHKRKIVISQYILQHWLRCTPKCGKESLPKGD